MPQQSKQYFFHNERFGDDYWLFASKAILRAYSACYRTLPQLTAMVFSSQFRVFPAGDLEVQVPSLQWTTTEGLNIASYTRGLTFGQLGSIHWSQWQHHWSQKVRKLHTLPISKFQNSDERHIFTKWCTYASNKTTMFCRKWHFDFCLLSTRAFLKLQKNNKLVNKL